VNNFWVKKRSKNTYIFSQLLLNCCCWYILANSIDLFDRHCLQNRFVFVMLAQPSCAVGSGIDSIGQYPWSDATASICVSLISTFVTVA